jgi:hypothetical protein
MPKETQRRPPTVYKKFNGTLLPMVAMAAFFSDIRKQATPHLISPGYPSIGPRLKGAKKTMHGFGYLPETKYHKGETLLFFSDRVYLKDKVTRQYWRTPIIIDKGA